jgi:hypothetical protein
MCFHDALGEHIAYAFLLKPKKLNSFIDQIMRKNFILNAIKVTGCCKKKVTYLTSTTP